MISALKDALKLKEKLKRERKAAEVAKNVKIA
jgi:hypothetical protein